MSSTPRTAAASRIRLRSQKAVLAFLITPLLGDALGNNRGYIQRALLAIAFIGFIPGIVAALYALGGGAGG